MPKSNQDDMVTYATVETKGYRQLKENVAPSREVVHSWEHVQLWEEHVQNEPLLEKERNTSASPEAPVTQYGVNIEDK